MTLCAALLALLAATLLQNLAEAWSGGHALPAVLVPLLPKARHPAAALTLISLLLAALILLAVRRPSRNTLALAAMAAGTFALNGVLQLAASALAGRPPARQPDRSLPHAVCRTDRPSARRTTGGFGRRRCAFA